MESPSELCRSYGALALLNSVSTNMSRRWRWEICAALPVTPNADSARVLSVQSLLPMVKTPA